jgi:putative OPT family oligopeptide transporter
LSGIGILVVIGAALLLVIGVKPYVSPDAGKALMAFALFTTAVIFNVAAIANNNLQDLKTGQLVDATPWKQQVALVIGVIAGALVIPPVLDLMNHTYGFAGAPGADPRRALPAPQAGLISSLAKGVIAADIDWSLIGIGALIGVAIVLLDEILARTSKEMRVPPLAVGLGIYLPTSSTLMIIVGAVVGWLYDRRADRTPRPEASKQLGVLLASGLIVGEGVIAVVISLIKAFSSKPAPLALVGPDGVLAKWIPILAKFETASIIIGGVAFALIAVVQYRWILRMARRNVAR